jgi:hypothetical protein
MLHFELDTVGIEPAGFGIFLKIAVGGLIQVARGRVGKRSSRRGLTGGDVPDVGIRRLVQEVILIQIPAVVASPPATNSKDNMPLSQVDQV